MEQQEAAKKTPEEFARLQEWAGRWTTEERYEANEWMKEGGSAKGEVESRIGPGGIYIEEYHSTGSPMGKWDGHLVITWNDKESRYKVYWFDSFNPKGTFASGTWQGNRLVFEGESVHDGKPRAFRMSYEVDGDRRTLLSEEGPKGGAMQKMFTIDYKRATTH